MELIPLDIDQIRLIYNQHIGDFEFLDYMEMMLYREIHSQIDFHNIHP
jgi:hypothetical protein